jgi:AraC-like DNA-binding protein
MEILLIIGFSQAFILCGLILMKKESPLHDRFLAILFFIHGLTLFLGYMEIYNRANGYPYPFFINSSAPLILLHGPLLWYYIKTITTHTFRFRFKYLLHFLPFLIVFLLIAKGSYTLPASERIDADINESFKDDLAFPIGIGLILVSTQGYFFWGINLISNYRKKIKNYFSDVSEKDLKWLKILLTACIIFYAGISLLYIADFIFSILPYEVMQPMGYSYAAVFVLVLAFFGHKQGNIFHSHNIEKELTNLPDFVENDKIDDPDSDFIKSFIYYMKEKKPFLDTQITLAALSKKLNVTPEYLSGILNGKLNRNFFDFINYYRIEEFKRLCRENKNQSYTILGLAWDAGFNSKATFNRVFKNATGMTPGDYLKQCKPVES